MPYADLPKTRLYYEEEGSGPAIVLLHGLGASGEDWEFQRPFLAPHFRVIVPDLRGFGRSPPADGYRVPRFAADLWALLELLRIDRFDLVGHSMGGAVAQQMAVEQPLRIERLVLADTLPSFHTNTFGKRLMFVFRYATMGLLGPERLAKAVARTLFPGPNQQALRDRALRRGGANDRAVYLETIRGLVGWSVADRLERISMPTLVLAAEHDYFPVEDAESFAAGLPNARLKIFPGAHHAMPLEIPEAFAAELLDFLLPQRQPLRARA